MNEVFDEVFGCFVLVCSAEDHLELTEEELQVIEEAADSYYLYLACG